jgi:hypothetical protein
VIDPHKHEREPRAASPDSNNSPDARTRHEALYAQARERHDRLTDSIEALERAIAEAGVHRERPWSQHAATELEQVRHSIRWHAEGVEAPGSLFDEIEAVEPSLRKRVRDLRQEHLELAARATALAEKLTRPGRLDAVMLRREAGALTSDLRAHRGAEADLSHEAFWAHLEPGD